MRIMKTFLDSTLFIHAESPSLTQPESFIRVFTNIVIVYGKQFLGVLIQGDSPAFSPVHAGINLNPLSHSE